MTRDMNSNRKEYFVNFSNHPSDMWDEAQREAASAYGEIIDVPFPNVDPNLGEDDLYELAERFVKKIIEYDPAAVMCQGEFTLCFSVVQKLRAYGIKTLSACTERNVIVQGDKKISVFKFVQFREY